MKRLTTTQLEAAHAWLRQHGRPVDRALFACAYFAATPNLVAHALAGFQNRDGGLGHALEPDVRCPQSSALATSLGLTLCRDAGVGDDHIVLQRAMLWFINNFDRGANGWPIVPKEVSAAPCAPWWTYREPAACTLNPRAEILSHFYGYPDLGEEDFRLGLTDLVVNDVLAAPAPFEMHDFLCCVRLAEAPGLADAERARLVDRLSGQLDGVVCTDPAKWTTYVCRPLDIAPRPDSLFAESLAKPLANNLDYLIDEQLPDGTWQPVWNWGDKDKTAWPDALRDWTSYLTARNLIILKRYGRAG